MANIGAVALSVPRNIILCLKTCPYNRRMAKFGKIKEMKLIYIKMADDGETNIDPLNLAVNARDDLTSPFEQRCVRRKGLRLNCREILAR